MEQIVDSWQDFTYKIMVNPITYKIIESQYWARPLVQLELWYAREWAKYSSLDHEYLLSLQSPMEATD